MNLLHLLWIVPLSLNLLYVIMSIIVIAIEGRDGRFGDIEV